MIDVSGYNIVVVVIDGLEIAVHVGVSRGMDKNLLTCDCFFRLHRASMVIVGCLRCGRPKQPEIRPMTPVVIVHISLSLVATLMCLPVRSF